MPQSSDTPEFTSDCEPPVDGYGDPNSGPLWGWCSLLTAQPSLSIPQVLKNLKLCEDRCLRFEPPGSLSDWGQGNTDNRSNRMKEVHTSMFWRWNTILEILCDGVISLPARSLTCLWHLCFQLRIPTILNPDLVNCLDCLNVRQLRFQILEPFHDVIFRWTSYAHDVTVRWTS